MAKPGLFTQAGRLIRYVVPEVMRPIRTLWHEVIGFLFISLALLGIPQAFRRLRGFDGDPRAVFELFLIGCFIAVMLGYGISSFRRARRASRS